MEYFYSFFEFLCSMRKSSIVIIWLILILVISITSPVRNAVADLFETKPISETTKNVLKKNKIYFTFYSKKYSIPILSIQSAYASEINRRIFISYFTDYCQDLFFKSSLYPEILISLSRKSKVQSRYLNISQQDIGLGNIRLETAINIVEKYKSEFPFIKNNKQIISYLLTDKGNIHIGSLVIKDGMNLFEPYYKKCNGYCKAAILYSFYKQGESYYSRYINNSKFNVPPKPDPEGLTLVYQINFVCK